MSRSAPVLTNPATQYWKWSSDNQCFQYWDKTANDGDGETISVPEKTPFIVLDTLFTCAGYSDDHEQSLYSNEVRNVRVQPFVVRAGKKVILEGLWADIKGKYGVKFANSVYALAKIDGEYKVVNIKMVGTACSQWIEFVQSIGGSKALFGDAVIACTGASGPHKKGKTEYYSPEFAIITNKLSEEAGQLAIEADKELQEYLKAYFNKAKDDSPEEDIEKEFEKPAEENVEEKAEDKPFDPEDVPF